MRRRGSRSPGGARRADGLARAAAPEPTKSLPSEHDKAVHGLEVHQLELEMQVESLRDAHAHLEESRARYAALYDKAPFGHLTLDAFGNIRQLNLTCADLLGRERRLLEGLPLRALLESSSRRALDAHLRASLSSRETTSVELTVLIDGAPRPIELVTAPTGPFGKELGTEVALHSAVIDISERRRDDERRERLLHQEREARLLAEGANQIKEDFLAVVSHELRTPLAPMLLWLKALRAGGAGETLRTRAISALEASIKVQVAMIDDLVDVTRGRHGKLHIDRQPMDLRPVVCAAVDACAPSAAAKLLEVRLDLTTESAFVSGDDIRLQQVVQNLLSNAIKFTQEGGHISISLNVARDELRLVVSDDGEGIEAELLEEVFEPFRQRERTPTRRHGGLGLGLTIVQQLVSEHDGVVVAESAGRGKGASFTVKLPRLDLNARRAEPPSTSAEEPGAQESAGSLAGVRVLIVEDHDDTREAMAAILRSTGAEVMTAATPLQAWKALDERRPDVLISDIGMPGEDGYTFIRRLRDWENGRHAPRLPAIAVTAHAGPRDKARALVAGFDRHLAKPLAFEALVGTLFALVPRPGARPRPA